MQCWDWGKGRVVMSQTCKSLFTATAKYRQRDALNRLADTIRPREVAAAIVELALSEPGCKSATVVLGFNGAGNCETEPATTLDPEEMDLVRAANERAASAASAGGRRLAMPLFQPNPLIPASILLLEMDGPFDGLIKVSPDPLRHAHSYINQ